MEATRGGRMITVIAESLHRNKDEIKMRVRGPEDVVPTANLLREMLEEDPADDALLQVSEDLVRRCRWAGCTCWLAVRPSPLSRMSTRTSAWSTPHSPATR
mgnify:CR=1 FL=1